MIRILLKHAVVSAFLFGLVAGLPVFTTPSIKSPAITFTWIFTTLWLPYLFLQAISLRLRGRTFQFVRRYTQSPDLGVNMLYTLLWGLLAVLCISVSGHFLKGYL